MIKSKKINKKMVESEITCQRSYILLTVVNCVRPFCSVLFLAALTWMIQMTLIKYMQRFVRRWQKGKLQPCSSCFLLSFQLSQVSWCGLAQDQPQLIGRALHLDGHMCACVWFHFRTPPLPVAPLASWMLLHAFWGKSAFIIQDGEDVQLTTVI